MAYVWTADAFISNSTHPLHLGYGFGRAVALSPEGTRLFVAWDGSVSEFVVDPMGPIGWTRVGDVTVLSDGFYVNQMQVLASDGELYAGDFVQNDGTGFDLYYRYGGVTRATLSGGAYVGDAGWANAPEIAPSLALKTLNGCYGFGLALSGDGLTMAISQPGEGGHFTGNLFIGAGYGSVWIFRRASLGDPWVADTCPEKMDPGLRVYPPPHHHQEKPEPEAWHECDFWGCGLALNSDGTRLLVGETGDPWSALIGNVYVYEYAGGAWTERQVIHGDETQNGGYDADFFGWSVCGDADLHRIFIGAPHSPNERGTTAGTVFVYESDEGADPGDPLYTQTERILSPITSNSPLPLANQRWVRSFGASLSCDATGDNLVVGCSNALNYTVDMDQEVPGAYNEGVVFLLSYAAEPEPTDAEKEAIVPEPTPYDDGSGGTAYLFPYRPLVPVVEALEWTTDVVEAYDGSERRRGARAIPRQSWEWRVLVQDGAYYTAFRGLMTEQWWVPSWHEGMVTTGAIADGAATLTVPATVTDYGEWLDYLALWYAPGWCEVIGISSIVGDTITLATVVQQAYPAGSVVMPARLCRMGTAAQVTDSRDFGLIDLAWVLLDGQMVEPFQLDEAEPLADLPLAPDGLLERALTSQVTELNYGTGLLDFDVQRNETKWAADLTLRHSTRAAAWNRRIWLYSLQGRHGGFYLPTGRGDVRIAAPFTATDTNLQIERVNYYNDLYAHVDTDRALCFWRMGTTGPVIRQVTEAHAAVADVERVVLVDDLGFAGGPATFPFISWCYQVRPSADRIELSWESPTDMVMTVPVIEADTDSQIE